MKKKYITPGIVVHVLDEDLCTTMLTVSNEINVRTPGNDTNIPLDLNESEDHYDLPEIRGDETYHPNPA